MAAPKVSWEEAIGSLSAMLPHFDRRILEMVLEMNGAPRVPPFFLFLLYPT